MAIIIARWRIILHRHEVDGYNSKRRRFRRRSFERKIAMPSDYMITTITRADRPNSAQSASGGSSTLNVFMGCKAKVIPYELKCDIAGVVRAFEFVNAADGYLPGGNSMLRARIGHAVLTECGISSRVVCGARLYRVGKHRIRDMLRYCLPDNTGGYYEGYACGHLWIEVDDDIVDFCPAIGSPRRRCWTRRPPIRTMASWGRWSGVSCRRNSFGNLHIL